MACSRGSTWRRPLQIFYPRPHKTHRRPCPKALYHLKAAENQQHVTRNPPSSFHRPSGAIKIMCVTFKFPTGISSVKQWVYVPEP